MLQSVRTPSRLRSRASRNRRGFTVVDVVIAAVILVIAIGGLSSAVVSTMALNRENEETAAAYAAVKSMTEQIQDVDFEDIFATFNVNILDDPDGIGTGRGSDFAVFGLQAQQGDADGLVGQVIFPTISVGAVEQLREDVVDTDVGMPRDITGDGVVDALDHSGDYILLPVTLQLDWQGGNGNRRLTVSVLLIQ